MKIIPNLPACQNMDELERLTKLICSSVHPEVIILFGKYAGMSLANIQGGYEILVLTKDLPATTYRNVREYLEVHFPLSERIEKNLTIHLFSLDFVRRMSALSHFFFIIRREGILLYKREGCAFKEHIKFKPSRVLRHVRDNSFLAWELGKEFSKDAQKYYEIGNYRMAAFNLYQTFAQFVRAVIFAYYGFVPESKETLQVAYSHIRYCSDELAHLWGDNKDYQYWYLLGHLQGYNYHARFSTGFKIDKALLGVYLEKSELFYQAATSYCKKNIRLLESMKQPGNI